MFRLLTRGISGLGTVGAQTHTHSSLRKGQIIWVFKSIILAQTWLYLWCLSLSRDELWSPWLIGCSCRRWPWHCLWITIALLGFLCWVVTLQQEKEFTIFAKLDCLPTSLKQLVTNSGPPLSGILESVFFSFLNVLKLQSHLMVQSEFWCN